jgi:prepilin-type N-terminal cleavage/methylation domain-containing protein
MNVRHRLAGFTLIEMMVVLTVMAITMTVLLQASSGRQDQVRYNQTVERYDRIKKAIVDVSNLNGIPMVSGFAADMGRLPMNLHELMEPQLCRADIASTDEANCEGGWLALAAWGVKSICADGSPQNGQQATCSISVCPDGSPQNGLPPTCTINNPSPTTLAVSLNAGWHGPYFQSTQNPSHVDIYSKGSDAFTDGWGNEGYNTDRSFPDPRHNYGWYLNWLGSSETGYNPRCAPAGVVVSRGNCLTVFSYGNGCFRDSSLCKGNNAAPEALDFTYPLSASPPNIGMAYDPSLNLAITPDLYQVSVYGLTLPAGGLPDLPPPMVRPNEWQVDIGSPNTVNVLIAPKLCKPLGATGVTVEDCSVTPVPLCLNIYHIASDDQRNPVAAVVSSGVSSIGPPTVPATIPENGMALQVSFAFPSGTVIPAGNAAISVHAGPCTSPNGTSTLTYPSTGRQAVPVKILPGRPLSLAW